MQPAGASLELATKLVTSPRPGWRLALYPDAREGSGSFRWSGRPSRVPLGRAPDQQRAEYEAARRAKGKLRRYCAANRLNRLGTLTYAGEGLHDPHRLREHIGAFFRSLRRGLGGEAFAYAWVGEWHSSGHGLHVHFGLGQYVAHSLIASAWPHGFVHIKLLGELPNQMSGLAQARIAAGYLGKYVGKALGALKVPGLHRYEVAQGFQPRMVVLEGASSGEVMAQASALMRAAPETVWRSSNRPLWEGPPAIWARWP